MATRPPIIGIAGAARTGKDTTANFIIAAVGGYRYGLADPIRNMLTQIGVDMSDPYWQDNKEQTIPALGVSPRRLMQTLGTEWGRQLVHPNLWLILAQQRLLKFGPGMVIPDVRFDNEAQWVRDRGGMIIHLKRSTASGVALHASEGGVVQHVADKTLINDGTLEELQQSVRELLSGFDQT